MLRTKAIPAGDVFGANFLEVRLILSEKCAKSSKSESVSVERPINIESR